MADQLEQMRAHITVWQAALNLRMLIHVSEKKALEVLLVAAYIKVPWEDLVEHAKQEGELLPAVASAMGSLSEAVRALDA